MSNHAIIIKAAGHAELVKASIPKLRDDYIIVKVKAVALNPTDILHIDHFASPGARVGCDYAGIVEEVGSTVTKRFRKGDRVAGFVHGSNAVEHEDGTFGEYITAKGDLQIHIPDNLSFEQAATIGVGITTVGQALYQSLSIPKPETPAIEKFPILIYGGSSATGVLAIQYAKLSGLEVITTASKPSFDYLKSLGADAVFDYGSPACAEDIKNKTKRQLKHVFDCVSKGDSTKISVEAMSDEGGVYTTLQPVPKNIVSSINDKVTIKFTLAYSAIGEHFQFGKAVDANAVDFEFAKKFWEDGEKLLAEGKIKVHQRSVNEGGSGLEGVLKGLQLMREGVVKRKKLVYTL
jgi:NADPH:quinone reductase-like Zn-dependent oxidoreductase